MLYEYWEYGTPISIIRFDTRAVVVRDTKYAEYTVRLRMGACYKTVVTDCPTLTEAQSMVEQLVLLQDFTGIR